MSSHETAKVTPIGSANPIVTPELEKYIAEQVRLQVTEELKRQGIKVDRPKRMAIVATKGTLDMAYPPLILATTATAMDMEAAIFFSFYGLDIVNKKKYGDLKIPPLANPAMPVPMPNIVGVLPGMTRMASWMMKDWMKKGGVPTIPDLLSMAKENGVRLIACQMTLDVMGIKKEDLVDGLEFAGAGAFLDYAADADITLFV
ncbi:MAG: DsrE/DsrF/DrsH-like family protein [Syntrophobacterales bacterium]|jgi:peroxiredoxin family protein|nr:DsrE/DsrF/DrsH-like family protein [Syntrophobacterales bacterium]